MLIDFNGISFTSNNVLIFCLEKQQLQSVINKNYKSKQCVNEWSMRELCCMGRNTNEVYVYGVKLHFLSPCHCVVLEMSELIGVAGKCEVCFPPPPSPPPPPPPL